MIALTWLVVAVFAPLIAPYDPLAQTFTALQPPSLDHPFGTDELGRDVLSRVIYGRDCRSRSRSCSSPLAA